MNKQNNSRGRYAWILDDAKSYLLLILCAGVAIYTTLYLHDYTEKLLQDRLRERLISLAATSSLLFDKNEIDNLISLGDASVETPEYRDVVRKLRSIKRRNPDIRYVYIFSKTDTPGIVKFVADADILGLHPDLNYDGDEQGEGDWIGSEYDASDLPAISSGKAFSEVVTDDELGYDEWGIVFSAYAPIRNYAGQETDVIIGVDVDVTNYMDLVNATFIPFVTFIGVLLIILLSLTISLVWMWGSRVELLNELDRQKDELLSMVSHQLATPISSIKWYLEMLMDGDLGKISKEQAEHVTSMRAISENLSDLVTMILDVSRIQLGRMKTEKQPLNLNEFFHEILEVIKPKALEKKVKFEVSIPKDMPEAMLDKRYTRMTIENLLSNAVKYTPENGLVTWEVKISNNTIYCKVSDTGIGIPKKEQEKIFGKLYRASNARNAIDGNGFGLYVAKGAVEAQGGKIWFESEENKGTTFFVELPVKDQD